MLQSTTAHLIEVIICCVLFSIAFAQCCHRYLIEIFEKAAPRTAEMLLCLRVDTIRKVEHCFGKQI